MSWFSKLDRSGSSSEDEDLGRKAALREVSPDSVEFMPPFFSEISEFWFANREEGHVPDWSDFSPSTHKKLLPHIVLWEVVAEGYFARVVGEAAAKLLPVKVANQRLADIMTDEIAPLLRELDQTVSRNVPHCVDQPNAWILEDEIVHRRSVHLPFRAGNENTNRVLSVMYFSTEPKLDI